MTFLPWIAGCLTDSDPPWCGDDVYHPGGLDIELGGADDTQTYDFTVETPEATFDLTQPPGGSDRGEVNFPDGRRLGVGVSWGMLGPDDYGNLLTISYSKPPAEDQWGPDTATITVTMQGESIQHTLTPTYSFDQPHDERCHGYYYARELLGVPTP